MDAKWILKSKGRVVHTARPNDRIADIVATMKEKRIGALVVSDDGERVAGILSERDILHGLAAQGAKLLDMRVADLMTRQVMTCTPEDEIAELMSVMTSRRIRHIPVVVEGKLVGVVSIGDVVKFRLEEIESEANQLRDYIARA